MCDAKMRKNLKEKVYKTIIGPVLMYGAEIWTRTIARKEEELLEKAERRMLLLILGVSLKDKNRNEVIRKMLGVACITDKIRKARLRWYGHVCDEKRRRTLYEKNYDIRDQGTLQSRTTEEAMEGDIIQQDMKSLRLIKEHTGVRKKRRRRIPVTDLSNWRDYLNPEGDIVY